MKFSRLLQNNQLTMSTPQKKKRQKNMQKNMQQHTALPLSLVIKHKTLPEHTVQSSRYSRGIRIIATIRGGS